MKKQNIYLYPLEGKVIFPYHEYRFVISASLFNPQIYDNFIGFVTKLDDNKEYKGVEKIEGVSRYGTLLRIHKSDPMPGYAFDKSKGTLINYLGLTFARFKILSLAKTEGRLIASIQILQDQLTKQIQANLQKKGLIVNLKKELKVYYQVKLKQHDAQINKEKIDVESSINKLLFKAASQIDIPVAEKIKFLQLMKYDARFQFLLNSLTDKTEGMKGVVGIEEKVRQEMNKSTKKKLQTYLQGGMNRGREGQNQLSQRIKNTKLPENIRTEIDKQMKNSTPGQSKAVSQKYVQTLLDIPWLESSPEVNDINAAQKILHQDHTGLKDVKERILQFLAVKFRNGNSKGNIICLHGPPGVGKTSVAKSIAKSLGRHFTRVSLGGMSDEAELRGHRRTYVAALPGVIIRALIKAKTNNPVILLDQIQKLGKSYRGDPEHALLQILDPSQNNSFIDHYVGLPVDLSKVMFICTANSLELSIPLLNRLELIQVPGYSRQQKFEIAKNHLIPNQVKQNGIQGLIQFDNKGLVQIIKHSRQMGVRQLQRNISKICRKVARKGSKEVMNEQKVQQILGQVKKNRLWNGVGVVNGMAWTTLGGKVLTVESVQFKSNKQKIQVTGQLGEVMKQSVNIAFSWIKSNIQSFSNVSRMFFSNFQKLKQLDEISLHIHFPEGATKKDGPSAGVTIVTCLVSLLLKIPPRENLSMTGQITLSGKVLPVGGVRQKCIAAIYEGIKHIILPYDNLKDLEKIDQKLRQNINFYGVKDIKQVLLHAFPGLFENASKL